MRQTLAREDVADRRERNAAAVAVQSKVRQLRDRAAAERTRAGRRQEQETSAVLVQSCCRRRLAEEALRRKKAAAVLVQCAARRSQASRYKVELRRIRDSIEGMKVAVRKHESVIVIQKAARIAGARRRVERLLRERSEREEEGRKEFEAASAVQRRIRGCLARETARERRERAAAAVMIQKAVGRPAGARVQAARRRDWREKRVEGATRLQTAGRARAGRRVAERLRGEKRGATRVQSAWRGRQGRAERKRRGNKLAEEALVLRRRRSGEAVKIQCRIRQCLSREEVASKREQRASAVVLQCLARSRRARERRAGRERREEAATTVQRRARGKAERRRWLELLERHNCAIFIQTRARMTKAKKLAQAARSRKKAAKRRSATKVQTAARMLLARWKVAALKEENGAARAVQSAARGRAGRKVATGKRSEKKEWEKKVVLVQSMWRRRTGKGLAEWWKQWRSWEEACATKIQARARGGKCRREDREWREGYRREGGARMIQARVRGIKVRGWKNGNLRGQLYFGGVLRRPKSPVYFTWVRHFRKELLEGIAQESNKLGLFNAGGEAGELAKNFRMEGENRLGDTLFTLAASVGWGEGLALLKDYGANVGAANHLGNTAAHAAFKAGFEDLGYYLVDEAGVDDSVLNKRGQDCYDCSKGAVEGKRPDMYLGDGALGSDIKVGYEEHSEKREREREKY